MIDLAIEKVVTLGSAPNVLPRRRRGKQPHASTIYRWAKMGVIADDGVRVFLETIRVGRTLCTSVEALQRFCDYLSTAPTAIPAPRVVAANQRQRERADHEANERGL